MRVVSGDYIDFMDGNTGWEFSFSNKEYERLSNILNHLKKFNVISSLKEFAENINETSVGLNDLKKGRKKISIKHVLAINKSYSYINTDYILLGECLPFNDDFLIKKVNKKTNYERLELDKKKAKENPKQESNNEQDSNSIDSKNTITNKSITLYEKLVHTQDELLKAKNEIIELKDKIHALASKEKR